MSEEFIFPSAPKVQNNETEIKEEKYTPPRPPVLSEFTILKYDSHTGELIIDVNNEYSKVRVRNGSPIAGEGNIQKNKNIAIVLAILWGIVGAHLFYLGYNKLAIKRIVILIISSILCSIGIGVIGIIACFIFLISDIIKICKGQPLTKDENSTKHK